MGHLKWHCQYTAVHLTVFRIKVCVRENLHLSSASSQQITWDTVQSSNSKLCMYYPPTESVGLTFNVLMCRYCTTSASARICKCTKLARAHTAGIAVTSREKLGSLLATACKCTAGQLSLGNSNCSHLSQCNFSALTLGSFDLLLSGRLAFRISACFAAKKNWHAPPAFWLTRKLKPKTRICGAAMPHICNFVYSTTFFGRFNRPGCD